jgi:peptidoglycan/LPS O-acetylase OafA/YrhL
MYASMFASNWWFLSQGTDYFARNAAMSPFLPFWSLSLIVQVYVGGTLAYCLLYKLSSRCSPRLVDAVSVGAHLCILFYSLHFRMHAVANALYVTLYFHPLMWIWMFSLGALLARCLRSVTVTPRVSRICAAISLLFLLALMLSYALLQAVLPQLLYALLVAAALAVIAGSSPVPSSLLRVYSWPLLVHLGDISYFIFLLHWPIIVAYQYYIAS